MPSFLKQPTTTAAATTRFQRQVGGAGPPVGTSDTGASEDTYGKFNLGPANLFDPTKAIEDTATSLAQFAQGTAGLIGEVGVPGGPTIGSLLGGGGDVVKNALGGVGDALGLVGQIKPPQIIPGVGDTQTIGAATAQLGSIIEPIAMAQIRAVEKQAAILRLGSPELGNLDEVSQRMLEQGTPIDAIAQNMVERGAGFSRLVPFNVAAQIAFDPLNWELVGAGLLYKGYKGYKAAQAATKLGLTERFGNDVFNVVSHGLPTEATMAGADNLVKHALPGVTDSIGTKSLISIRDASNRIAPSYGDAWERSVAVGSAQWALAYAAEQVGKQVAIHVRTVGQATAEEARAFLGDLLAQDPKRVRKGIEALADSRAPTFAGLKRSERVAWAKQAISDATGMTLDQAATIVPKDPDIQFLRTVDLAKYGKAIDEFIAMEKSIPAEALAAARFGAERTILGPRTLDLEQGAELLRALGGDPSAALRLTTSADAALAADAAKAVSASTKAVEVVGEVARAAPEPPAGFARFGRDARGNATVPSAFRSEEGYVYRTINQSRLASDWRVGEFAAKHPATIYAESDQSVVTRTLKDGIFEDAKGGVDASKNVRSTEAIPAARVEVLASDGIWHPVVTGATPEQAAFEAATYASTGRTVSAAEMAVLQARGRGVQAGLTAERAPLTHFTENIEKVADDLYRRVATKEWGGATYDPRGNVAPEGADAWMYHGTLPSNVAGIEQFGLRASLEGKPNWGALTEAQKYALAKGPIYRARASAIGGIETAGGRAGGLVKPEDLAVSRDGGVTWTRVKPGETVPDGPWASGIGKTMAIPIAEAQDPVKFRAALERFVSENADALQSKDHYIGVFRDDKMGEVQFDVAAISRTAADAEALLAANAPQVSAYNFATGMGLFAPKLAAATPELSQAVLTPWLAAGTPNATAQVMKALAEARAAVLGVAPDSLFAKVRVVGREAKVPPRAEYQALQDRLAQYRFGEVNGPEARFARKEAKAEIAAQRAAMREKPDAAVTQAVYDQLTKAYGITPKDTTGAQLAREAAEAFTKEQRAFLEASSVEYQTLERGLQSPEAKKLMWAANQAYEKGDMVKGAALAARAKAITMVERAVAAERDLPSVDYASLDLQTAEINPNEFLEIESRISQAAAKGEVNALHSYMAESAPQALVDAGLGDSAQVVYHMLSDGREIGIPGGVDGTFSLWDAWKLKAQHIDPNKLDEPTRIALYDKLFRSQARALTDPVDTFNRIGLAILSPNTKLLDNEAALAAIRVTSMEELKAFADAPFDVVRQRIMDAGGGATYPAQLKTLQKNAKKFVENPEWFAIRRDEGLIEYSERVMSVLDGAGMKVGNFAAMLGDPLNFERGTIDSRMVERLIRERRIPEDVAARHFVKGVYLAPNAKPVKLTLRGKPNPEVPESLRNLPWKRDDDMVMVFDRDYKVFSDALDALLKQEHPGLTFKSGGGQWYLWDLERGLIEPHTTIWPNASKLPRMEPADIRAARAEAQKGGYYKVVQTGNKEAGMAVSPSQAIFYQKTAAGDVQGWTLRKGSEVIIGLTDTANPSTALHEMWHGVIWDTLAPEDIAIFARRGLDKEGTARAWERWLYDGIAPHPSLVPIFEKAKALMMGVYTRLTGTSIEQQLHPEVKATFDRLFMPPVSEDAVTVADSALQTAEYAVRHYDQFSSLAGLRGRALIDAVAERAQKYIENDALPHTLREAVSGGQPIPSAMREWEAKWAASGYRIGFMPKDEAKIVTLKDGTEEFLQPFMKVANEVGNIRTGTGMSRVATASTRGISYSKIKNTATLRMIQNGARLRESVGPTAGITEWEARQMVRAIFGRAQELTKMGKPTTPRALGAYAYDDIAKEVLGEERYREFTNSGGDMLALVMDSFAGNWREVGLTQKITGEAKSASRKIVPGITEDIYPKLRFVYSPGFQYQEYIESPILNMLRGVKPVWREKGANKVLDEARRIYGELMDVSDEARILDDAASGGTLYLAGSRATAQHFGVGSKIGNAISHLYPSNIAGVKMANQVKQVMVEQPGLFKEAITNINPRIWNIMEQTYGTKEPAKIVEAFMSERMAFQDPAKFVDLLREGKTAFDPKGAEMTTVWNAFESAFQKSMVQAHTTHFFPADRSWLERTINHPYLGLYPFSYMMKVGKEFARFMLKKPFGLDAPLVGYLSVARIQKAIVEQEALDPEGFGAFMKDNPDVMYLLNIMLPGLPTDLPANLPAVVRHAAQRQAEGRPFSPGQVLRDTPVDTLGNMGLGRDINVVQGAFANVYNDLEGILDNAAKQLEGQQAGQ